MARRPWLDDPLVEEDSEWIDILPNGEVRNAAWISLCEADYRRMYEGWVCAWCLAIWEEQWPGKCSMPGCDSATSELGDREMTPAYQRQFMEERFKGHDWIGPSRQTHEAGQNALDRIWVPGDAI